MQTATTREIVIRAKGAESVAALGKSLEQMGAEAKAAGINLDGLGDTVVKVADRRLARSERAGDVSRLLRSYDQVGAQLRKLEADERKLQKVMDDGRATAEDVGRALDGLRKKRDQLAAATQREAEAARAAATAQAEAAEAARRAAAQAEIARREGLQQQAAAAQAGINHRLGVSAAPSAADHDTRQADYAALGAEMDRLQAKYDDTFRAGLRYRQALDDLNAAHRVGAVAGDAYQKALDRIEAELNPAAIAARRAADEEQRLAQAAAASRARWVEGDAALQRYRTALVDLAAAHKAGHISAAEHQAAEARLKAQYEATGKAATAAAGGTRLAAHEAANLTYQLQDVVVSLGSGQSPFTVLLQQGPQITSIFGGVRQTIAATGAALKAVPAGVYAAGAAIAAVGAVVVGTAARLASMNAELRAFAASTRLNPALAGQESELRAAGFRIAADRGTDRDTANAALDAVVRDRRITSVALAERIAGLSVDVGAVLGDEPAAAAKRLAEAFGRGAAGVAELDQALGFLTASQAASIRAMDRQGDRAGALQVAIGALEERFGGAAAAMQSEWGRALHDLGRAWDGFWERLADSGPSRLLARGTGWVARGLSAVFGPPEADTPEALAIDIAARGAMIADTEAMIRRIEGEIGTGSVDDAVARDELARERAALATMRAALADTERRSAALASASPLAVATGISADEQKAIDAAAGALDRYTAALGRTEAERRVVLAGEQAFAAALAEGRSAEAARAEQALAERRVRAELAAAIQDQVRGLDLEAQANLFLADAIALGTRAELEQLAANDAHRAALGGVIDQEVAYRDALLERQGAAALVEGARDVAGLQRRVAGLKAVADAELVSARAAEDAARQAEVEAENERLLAAAYASRSEVVIEWAERQAAAKKALSDQAAEEQRRAQGNRALRDARDDLRLAQTELGLAGRPQADRDAALAHLKAMEEAARLFGSATSEAGRRLVQMRDDAFATNRAVQQQQAIWDELGRIGESAMDRIGGALTQALVQGKVDALSLRNVLLGVASEVAQAFLRMALVNPLVNAVAGTSRPSLWNLGGGVRSGGGAGGPGTGGVSIGDVAGLADRLGSGGGGGSSFFGKIGSGIQDFLGSHIIAPSYATLAPSAAIPINGMAVPIGGAQVMTAPGLTVGQGLGAAAALGMGAYSLSQGDYVGGATSILGAGAGLAAAAGIAPAILGPAAIALPIAGTLLGGLFGGKSRGDPYAGGNLAADGAGNVIWGSGGDNNADIAAVSRQAAEAAAGLNAFMARYGLKAGSFYGTWNEKDGPDAAIRAAIAAMRGTDDTTSTILNRVKGGVGSLDELASHLDFARVYDAAVKAAGEETSAYSRALQQVRDQYEPIIDRARAYGLATDALTEAMDRGIRELERRRDLELRAWDDTLQARALRLEGRDVDAAMLDFDVGARAEVEQARQTLKDLGLDAADVAGRIAKLERVIGQERERALQELLARQSRTLQDWLDRQLLGPTTALTRMGQFEAAQRQFDAERAAAATAPDREAALARVTQAADALLGLSRDVWGTATGHTGEVDRVRSAVKALGRDLGLPGFATGGRFTVAGWGGVDSTLVKFWATPGEQVQVYPPANDPAPPVVVPFRAPWSDRASAPTRQDAPGSAPTTALLAEIRDLLAAMRALDLDAARGVLQQLRAVEARLAALERTDRHAAARRWG